MTSSIAIRAVNGVIGSKRTISSTAFGDQLRVLAQRLPLLGVLGEQPQAVRELALRRVDAADEHVQHEVEQLDVVGAVQQLGDQVLAGRLAAGLHAARSV